MIYTKEYWNDVEKVIKFIPNIEHLKGRSILITGASGMIGSSIVDILFYLNKMKLNINMYLAGRDIAKIRKRFSDFDEGREYFYVKYDATKTNMLEVSPDFVIYGAGNASPAIYSEQPVETMTGNIIGLNQLLHFATMKKVKRLLYISSSEVYGNKNDVVPYSEKEYGFVDILNPRACYPCAKRAAETLCVSYGVEYGIDTVIVRPGHVYGPTIARSDSRASAQFTWNVIDDKDIIMKSSGTQMRSYCYTLDCASAVLTVLINGKTGNAYNVSNRDSVISIRNMAETLARHAGKKIVFERPTDAELESYNMMDNSILNADKLEELGWRAVFDLDAGVISTIRTLREEIKTIEKKNAIK